MDAWFEDPKNKTAMAFQSSLSALASRLSIGLAARQDPMWGQFISMADNITGGMNAAGGGSANQKALDVLHNGLKNAPEHDYYQAGDKALLPQSLIDAGLTVQILGPPIDPSLVSQMNYKAQQYLSDNAQSDGERIKPFPQAFTAGAKDYPPEAFKFYPAEEITKLINSVQPDVLAAQAVAADKTLNNQSLVLLFTIAGKTLLFAGDASGATGRTSSTAARTARRATPKLPKKPARFLTRSTSIRSAITEARMRRRKMLLRICGSAVPECVQRRSMPIMKYRVSPCCRPCATGWTANWRVAIRLLRKTAWTPIRKRGRFHCRSLRRQAGYSSIMFCRIPAWLG